MRAISGYGKHGVFHTTNELDSSSESSYLPLAVVVTDREAVIAEFFSSVQEIVKDKFVTCQTIEVLSPLVTLQGQ